MSQCICCHGNDLEPIITCPSVPIVINALADDEAAARAAPTGDVALVACRTCGLVYNDAFDPARVDYVADYENPLHFSPSFQAFADRLVADLVRRHDLDGKSVVEIGCGDGYMLSRFLAAGVAKGIGFDPSMAGRTSPYASSGMSIVPDYFEPATVDVDYDMIVCRHVLEHLPDPQALLSRLREQIGDRSPAIYIEVPNAQWMLETTSIWDVIYEHVSYWTEPAIEALLRRCGFMPTHITHGYGGQFLMVEAVPTTADPNYRAPNVDTVLRTAQEFGKEAAERIGTWRQRLANHKGSAVVWGAGSKGITFANTIGRLDTGLVAMTDLNPRKHGHCVPGAALPIVDPDTLGVIRPNLVLISNGLYEDEIRQRLAAQDLYPEIWVITGAPQYA